MCERVPVPSALLVLAAAAEFLRLAKRNRSMGLVGCLDEGLVRAGASGPEALARLSAAAGPAALLAAGLPAAKVLASSEVGGTGRACR
jgi:hypothetical protein